MEKREDMSIPVKANGKPLELSVELGNVIILAKTEYEPNCNRLKALKFVKLIYVRSR